MSFDFDLAVDFGTSNTAAVLRRSDGRVQSVLFDGSPVLPSAVCMEPSGRTLVGKDALAGARMYPGSVEPYPKRCVDDGEILLGGRALPVSEVFGAVLGRVCGEARRLLDRDVRRVVLTHPVAWGARRQAVLRSAAAAAGIHAPVFVTEPVAAAASYVDGAASRLAVGDCVLVYDFGGGTFDASVVRRTAGGFEVLAAEGLRDAGGLDIDAAIVATIGAVYAGREADAWRQMEQAVDPAGQRARRQLWEDIRAAKEMLSRGSNAIVHVPALGIDVPVGREQLEMIARPILERTLACTKSALLEAGLTGRQLSAVLLVGGSSRMPLVGTLLHQAFGIAPIAFEQPELVVASM